MSFFGGQQGPTHLQVAKMDVSQNYYYYYIIIVYCYEITNALLYDIG